MHGTNIISGRDSNQGPTDEKQIVGYSPFPSMFSKGLFLKKDPRRHFFEMFECLISQVAIHLMWNLLAGARFSWKIQEWLQFHTKGMKWVRSPVEANFLSGVFSPLTSAEACEEYSRWLWKESCISTGLRKPENTCASTTVMV